MATSSRKQAAAALRRQREAEARRKRIVFGDYTNMTVPVWDVATGKELRTYAGHVDGVPCVAFGPGGRMHPDARGGSMHAVGEHVLIDDCVIAARIYLAMALDLCSRKAA